MEVGGDCEGEVFTGGGGVGKREGGVLRMRKEGDGMDRGEYY